MNEAMEKALKDTRTSMVISSWAFEAVWNASRRHTIEQVLRLPTVSATDAIVTSTSFTVSSSKAIRVVDIEALKEGE